MKLLILLSFLILYCNLSEQFAEVVNCNHGERPLEDPETTCVRVTCTSVHSFSVLGCGTYKCPHGQQIGFKTIDHNKMYPECCGGPICGKYSIQ